MNKRRVIFVPDDHWTDPLPKEPTVTEQPTDNTDNMLIYRGQLAAINLSRAVAASDGITADAMYAAEEQHGLLKYLVAGLTHLTVSLCRTVVQQHDDPNVDEERVWASLTDRSTTGLIATHEIIQLTEDGDLA